MSGILNSPIFWIIVIVLVLIIFIYNNLNASKHRVEKSFSTIDTYLQEKESAISLLIDGELNAINAETDMQTEIANLRSLAGKSKSGNINDRINLDNSFRSFVATYENYPQLQSIDLFKQTATEEIKKEANISAARRQYNNNATNYNIKITSFPTSIFANMFGFGEKFQLFELTAKQREDMTNGTNLKTGAAEAMRRRNENR